MAKSWRVKMLALVAALVMMGEACGIQPQAGPQIQQPPAFQQPAVQPAAPAQVIAPTPQPTSNPAPVPSDMYAPNGTYTNVDGNEVPSPYKASSAPAGASARCRDGSYSFSQHRSGTCSHHGGVDEWL